MTRMRLRNNSSRFPFEYGISLEDHMPLKVFKTERARLIRKGGANWRADKLDIYGMWTSCSGQYRSLHDCMHV